MSYIVRPISDRTTFTGRHRVSPFRSSWSVTEDLLLRETGALRARNLVLEVDVTEGQIRVDGRLYARAQASTPAVRVAFDSEHGPLTYATDRFWTWQDNVRAIALGLEALRKVDRYGITERGEQYTGFKAIGGGTPLPAAPTMDRDYARRLVLALAGADAWPLDLVKQREIVREARKAAHPDRNAGDHSDAYELDQALQALGLAS